MQDHQCGETSISLKDGIALVLLAKNDQRLVEKEPIINEGSRQLFEHRIIIEVPQELAGGCSMQLFWKSGVLLIKVQQVDIANDQLSLELLVYGLGLVLSSGHVYSLEIPTEWPIVEFLGVSHWVNGRRSQCSDVSA